MFSFLPLFYCLMGAIFLHEAAHPKGPEPPPVFVGWLFIGFGILLFLVGIAFAICVILSGRFISQRRRYWYIFVLACIELLFFPFGMVLGVFTIIVLSRDSVRECFGIVGNSLAPGKSGTKPTR